MLLPHVILQIGKLRKGTIAVLAFIRLLTRMKGTDVRIKAKLLRKAFLAGLTNIFGEVRVLVIHDQALLCLGARPVAAWHLAVPVQTIVAHGTRKVRQRISILLLVVHFVVGYGAGKGSAGPVQFLAGPPRAATGMPPHVARLSPFTSKLIFSFSVTKFNP